jgi:hypothetical protein
VIQKTLLIAVASGLLTASPAAARTIDVERAEEAVRTAAETLGEVDQATCWRQVIDARRSRHRADCVAWWVHTASGESCAVFYEARMAGHRNRRLKVMQTFQPWCFSVSRAAREGG